MVAFAFATLYALATLAIATPAHKRGGSCSTGKLSCCDSISTDDSSSSVGLSNIASGLRQRSDIPLGINCNPISVLGGGSGGSCNTQAACCDDIEENESLVPIGFNCVPVGF